MAFNDLREWISALDRAGELKRIRAEVDPVLEITEIADRVSKGAARKYGRARRARRCCLRMYAAPTVFLSSSISLAQKAACSLLWVWTAWMRSPSGYASCST